MLSNGKQAQKSMGVFFIPLLKYTRQYPHTGTPMTNNEREFRVRAKKTEKKKTERKYI